MEVEEGALDRLTKVLLKKGHNYKYEYLNAMGTQDLAVLYDSLRVTLKKRDDLYKKFGDLLKKKTKKKKTAFPRKRYPLIVECEVKDHNKSTKFLMIVVHLKAFGDSSSKTRRKLASDILAVIIDG